MKTYPDNGAARPDTTPFRSEISAGAPVRRARPPDPGLDRWLPPAAAPPLRNRGTLRVLKPHQGSPAEQNPPHRGAPLSQRAQPGRPAGEECPNRDARLER